MDAAVLVVGNDQFLTAYVNQIRNIMSGTVEVSSDLDQVVPLLQATQPAVLILQAKQVGSLELCHQIKQPQLAWTYCILINDCDSKTLGVQDEEEMNNCAEALEWGADAYLSIAQFAPTVNRLLRAQIYAGLRGVQFYRELRQTNDVLSTMALADPLTELNNRRAMEWELPRQTQNARNYGTALSLIILDVDYFKSVNDTYGHQIGDLVLQLLAARLQHNLRLQDTIFRYGGEEFVIVLNQTNIQEAKIVANRLRRLISDQPFNIDGTLALQITISLGIATLNTEDDLKGEKLLRRADYNLLQAKSNGRNRVFCEENS